MKVSVACIHAHQRAPTWEASGKQVAGCLNSCARQLLLCLRPLWHCPVLAPLSLCIVAMAPPGADAGKDIIVDLPSFCSVILGMLGSQSSCLLPHSSKRAVAVPDFTALGRNKGREGHKQKALYSLGLKSIFPKEEDPLRGLLPFICQN